MDGLDSDVGHFPATPHTIPSRNKKIINDPIHGHILLDNYIVAAIDTLQFQRLRDLKQLGTLYYVFPGASHNRFEHCIGVSHLAGRAMHRFQSTQPELEITARDVELVKMAGLCHDLGHGPFSHAFESWMHKKSKVEWHHEHMSVRMLERMIDENQLDYSRDEVTFISDLITGKRPSDMSRSFLYEIVANSRNSVDVDKFDYLARDCYNLGIKSSYDSSRLMNHSRVIGGEICYHSKEAYNLYEMFHTRYSLHKQVYQHRVNKCIEFMMSDALAEADSVMRISEAAHDPDQYLYLTDSVLLEIARKKDPSLVRAQEIIRRIRTRRLYKFADEGIIPPDRWSSFPKEVTEESILKQVNNYGLKPEDIIIQNLTFNYAMKNRNPVDNVHFFSRWDDSVSFLIPRHQVSLLVPEQFEEKVLRIFVRNAENTLAAQNCFRDFLRMHSCYSSLSRGHELKAATASRSNSLSIISSTPPAPPSTKEQVTPSKSAGFSSPESAASAPPESHRSVKRKLDKK